MLALAALVWIMLASTILGGLVLAIVSVPTFTEHGMRLLPIAAGIVALLAVPASLAVARRLVAGIGRV
jgi:hypothetical protein